MNKWKPLFRYQIAIDLRVFVSVLPIANVESHLPFDNDFRDKTKENHEKEKNGSLPKIIGDWLQLNPARE